MLSRATGLRHAARATRTWPARPAITDQRTFPIARHISILPWRRKPVIQATNPPVYFPKPKSSPWRRPWQQPGRTILLRKIGRFTLATLIFCGCYEVFMTLVWDPLLDWNDAEWESMSEKERQEIIEAEEDDPPMIFLPFPFTTKAVPQPPYKGSDPEWVTFVSINKDRKMQESIRRELSETVRRGVEKHALFSQLLGSKSIKITKRWLEIIYPRGPPPKHYISGIFVDDDGIGWTERPIDPMALKHLDTAIRPTAVALGAWTWTSLVLKSMMMDVGRVVGFGAEAPPPTTWHSTIQGRPFKDVYGGKSSSSSPGGQAINSPLGMTGEPPPGIGPELSDLEKRMREHAQVASQGALLAFSKNWKPIKRPPTRGCIRVDGLVELQGEKAFMSVWVLGWYDPKAKKFIGIETRLKHLVQYKQKPAPN